ncbi:unnamed protein product [Effrenium voratum]|nr:unnamed protein product [Effrenium voratum]
MAERDGALRRAVRAVRAVRGVRLWSGLGLRVSGGLWERLRAGAVKRRGRGLELGGRVTHAKILSCKKLLEVLSPSCNRSCYARLQIAHVLSFCFAVPAACE